MKTQPFWTDDFPRPADLPVSPLPREVDVAIVGGGYTALSAARTLAKGRASVAVLEQNEIGSGASGRNGGQISTGLKEGALSLFNKYGPEVGRELWEASVEAVRSVERMVEQEQIDCDLTLSGSMELAYRPSHYEAQAKKAEWMARELDYHDFTLVAPEKMREEIGSDLYFGGLLDHVAGGIHPAKYVYGMARGTARAGALLCEHTKVEAIQRSAGSSGFEVLTSKGAVKANEVLIATNGYTGMLMPEIKRRVFPVGSYMITTEPLSPDLQHAINPKNHVYYDSKWFLNYFRLTPDGRATMGGRNNLSPNLDVVESAHQMHNTLLHIYPQLRGIPLTHTWSGRLGITFDLMPHIGQVKGVYYAFGYCGHGVTISTYLGQEVAKLIAGQIKRTPFAEIPHQTYFFYRNKAWFLPLAAAYYRFLDRLPW